MRHLRCLIIRLVTPKKWWNRVFLILNSCSCLCKFRCSYSNRLHQTSQYKCRRPPATQRWTYLHFRPLIKFNTLQIFSFRMLLTTDSSRGAQCRTIITTLCTTSWNKSNTITEIQGAPKTQTSNFKLNNLLIYLCQINRCSTDRHFINNTKASCRRYSSYCQWEEIIPPRQWKVHQEWSPSTCKISLFKINNNIGRTLTTSLLNNKVCSP